MTPWLDLEGDALSIVLVGDVNLRNVQDPSQPFALVKDTFDRADLRFANCEGCYADPGVEIPYKSGWFHPDRKTAEGLAVAGFDAMGCANNVHYGAEAILESLSHLDRLGIAHTGAGKNREAARKPAIVECRGVKFGFHGYTSVFWPVGHAAAPGQPGVATVKGHTGYEPHPRNLEMPGAPAIVHSWPDGEELAEMQEDVRELRKKVDVLVVSCHWGVSSDPHLAEYQPLLAHSAIDSGADLVLGHHPHVPQGVEVYKDRAIFYSLGNFMFGWEKMKARHPEGLLIHCSVDNRKIVKASYAPVYRNDAGQPRLVTTSSPEGRDIVQTVESLSKPLGTPFDVTEHEVVVWRA